jgi:hypothetical protein
LLAKFGSNVRSINPCCPLCVPMLVRVRKSVGSTVQVAMCTFRIRPPSSSTSMSPSARNLIAVGRLSPVSRISFWKVPLPPAGRVVKTLSPEAMECPAASREMTR